MQAYQYQAYIPLSAHCTDIVINIVIGKFRLPE